MHYAQSRQAKQESQRNEGVLRVREQFYRLPFSKNVKSPVFMRVRAHVPLSRPQQLTKFEGREVPAREFAFADERRREDECV